MMPKHARTENNDAFEYTDEVFEESSTEKENFNKEETAEVSSLEQYESQEDVSEELDQLEDVQTEVVTLDVLPAEEQQGKKDKQKKHLTIAQKKSRRMRSVLIVVIILVIALIGALGYFSYLLYEEAQKEATQQAINQGSQDVDKLKEQSASDNSTGTTKEVDIPVLMGLFGITQDEAIAQIGRGAIEASSAEVTEAGNPVKTTVKLTLTDEPGDSRSGTPTVYLDLDAEGHILSVGYSAATVSLGYELLSFRGVIEDDRIVENAFLEAGLVLPEGSVVLPEDKTLYSTFASDGTTLVTENYSFSGTVEQEGVKYEWSAVVRYDYTASNASGDLKDTIGQIYIYITDADAFAVAQEATLAQEAQAAEEAAAAAEAGTDSQA